MTRRKAVALVLAWALILPWAAGAEEEDVSAITTSRGMLRLVEDGRTRRLYLGRDQLYSGTDFLNFYREFNLDGRREILIRDFTGPVHCPVEYFFVSVPRRGEVHLSRAIGHCSAQPDITRKNGVIRMQFEPFGPQPGQTWTYDGQTLTLAR
jgi:hypothetical protein